MISRRINKIQLKKRSLNQVTKVQLTKLQLELDKGKSSRFLLFMIHFKMKKKYQGLFHPQFQVIAKESNKIFIKNNLWKTIFHPNPANKLNNSKENQFIETLKVGE